VEQKNQSRKRGRLKKKKGTLSLLRLRGAESWWRGLSRTSKLVKRNFLGGALSHRFSRMEEGKGDENNGAEKRVKCGREKGGLVGEPL